MASRPYGCRSNNCMHYEVIDIIFNAYLKFNEVEMS